MPGRLASRTIFVKRGNVIYTLIFSPNEPVHLPDVAADMNRLLEMATGSWVFPS